MPAYVPPRTPSSAKTRDLLESRAYHHTLTKVERWVMEGRLEELELRLRPPPAQKGRYARQRMEEALLAARTAGNLHHAPIVKMLLAIHKGTPLSARLHQEVVNAALVSDHVEILALALPCPDENPRFMSSCIIRVCQKMQTPACRLLVEHTQHPIAVVGVLFRERPFLQEDSYGLHVAVRACALDLLARFPAAQLLHTTHIHAPAMRLLGPGLDPLLANARAEVLADRTPSPAHPNRRARL